MFEKLRDIIELYKNKKVSQLVLEKEIMLAMSCNIEVEVNVCDPVTATSNITFGIAILPDKRDNRFSLKVIIDKRIFENRMLDSTTIARMLLENFKHRETILSEFNKLLKKDLVNISYSDIFTTLLKIYRISLQITRDVCSDYPEVLRILPLVSKVDEDVEMLNSGSLSLEEKKEKLITDGLLNDDFLKFAKRVEEIRRSVIPTPDEHSYDKPTENLEYNVLKAITDPPYNDNYKTTEIPYNYIPRT